MTYASVLTLIRPDQDDVALAPCLDFVPQAHLVVMGVAEQPPVPASAYDMLNGHTWAIEVDQARRLAQERAKAVEAHLAQKGQPGSVLAHVAGPDGLSTLVANASRNVDLVMLPGGGDSGRRLSHAIVTGGLFESGTPVLLSPAGVSPKETPERIVVAWNATPEAARAVKQALPLLKAAKDVKIVLVDPVPSAHGHGEEPGAAIAAFLAYHDIGVEVMPMPSEGHRVEEVLNRVVEAEGADLLVMGAYGHARLRERIFGGTTASILRDPPCPVFMAH